MADPCFYCGKPVDAFDAERIEGKRVVAHRSCLHARLAEQFGPDWQARITDANPASVRGARAVRQRKAGADA